MEPLRETHGAMHTQHVDDASDHPPVAPWTMRQLVFLEINMGHCDKISLTRAKAAAATSGDAQDTENRNTRHRTQQYRNPNVFDSAFSSNINMLKQRTERIHRPKTPWQLAAAHRFSDTLKTVTSRSDCASGHFPQEHQAQTWLFYILSGMAMHNAIPS